MSMSARLRTDATGNITIHMEGGLDFENSLPFRKELETLSEQNPTSTITLDMFSLDFVGSSGISFFVETIQVLNEKKQQIKLSNVKNEFVRVFKLYDTNIMDVIVQEFEDDETEGLAQRFANRKNTYQN
jgi:anti-sigma B factor antagonist